MARDLNNCSFIGRLTRDPETKHLQSGTTVTNFTIACSDDYNDKQSGQKVEQTEFINISAFGKLAEICSEYLTKGKQVFISGKFTTRKYQAQDGSDRWATSIKADNMQMLGSRDQGGNGFNQRQQASQSGGQGGGTAMADHGDFDDDIPFAPVGMWEA